MAGGPKKSVLCDDNHKYIAFVHTRDKFNFDGYSPPTQTIASVFIYDSIKGYMKAVAGSDFELIGYVACVQVIRKGSLYRLYVLDKVVMGRHDYMRYIDIDIGEHGIYAVGEWHSTHTYTNPMQSDQCFVMLDDDTLVVCGGYDRSSRGPISSCIAVDVNTGVVSKFPNMNNPREYHAAVHYKGTVVVIGGKGEKKESGPFQGVVCEQYDTVSKKWVEIGTPPMDSQSPCAVVVNGNIYLLRLANGRIGIYDGTTWTVLEITPVPARPAYIMGWVSLNDNIIRCWKVGWEKEITGLEILDLTTFKVDKFTRCKMSSQHLDAFVSF